MEVNATSLKLPLNDGLFGQIKQRMERCLGVAEWSFPQVLISQGDPEIVCRKGTRAEALLRVKSLDCDLAKPLKHANAPVWPKHAGKQCSIRFCCLFFSSLFDRTSEEHVYFLSKILTRPFSGF